MLVKGLRLAIGGPLAVLGLLILGLAGKLLNVKLGRIFPPQSGLRRFEPGTRATLHGPEAVVPRNHWVH